MTDLEHQHRLDVQLGRIAVALERIANALEAGSGPERFDEVFNDQSETWKVQEIPVIDGVATLPDGTTVRSTSDVVRVPVLNR